jgi:hypothetical protein
MEKQHGGLRQLQADQGAGHGSLGDESGSGQFLDDGYYYLEVAANLADGRGFTFDGINHTNGFHPLWQLAIVPVFWIVPDRTVAAFSIAAVQIVLFVLSGALLGRLVLRISGNCRIALAVEAAWLWNLWFWSKGAMTGMETALLLVLLGACLIEFVKLVERDRGAWRLGLLLAAACAARLDSLALAAACSLVLVVKRRRLDAMKTLSPPAVYTALYISVNALFAGGALPVSGFIKSSSGRTLLHSLVQRGDFSILGHARDNLLQFFSLGGRLPPLAAVLAALAACGTALLLVTGRGRGRRCVAAAVIGYIVLMLAYYSLMYESLLDAYTYYWLPAAFGLLAAGASWIGERPRGPVPVAAAVLVLAGTAGFDAIYALDRAGSYSFVVPEERRPEHMGVDFLNGLPPGSVIGSWDAGYLGYFTTHPVVNLDGLVNNYDYLRILTDEGLSAYLDSTGITHLANVDYFLGTREMIERDLGWIPVFEASSEFPRAVSVFTLSAAGRSYAESERRVFYVYGRPAENSTGR